MSKKRPQKKRLSKAMFVKLRVRPTRRMRESEFIELIETSIKRGIVQEGIELAAIDWEKKIGSKLLKSGEYLDESALDALASFHLMLSSQLEDGHELKLRRIE